MGSLETVRAKVTPIPVIGHWTRFQFHFLGSGQSLHPSRHSLTRPHSTCPLRVSRATATRGRATRTPSVEAWRPQGSPHPRDTHVQQPRKGAEAGEVALSSGAGQLPVPLLPDANPVGRSSHGLLVCTWGPLSERPHKAADRAHSVWPACGRGLSGCLLHPDRRWALLGVLWGRSNISSR